MIVTRIQPNNVTALPYVATQRVRMESEDILLTGYGTTAQAAIDLLLYRVECDHAFVAHGRLCTSSLSLIHAGRCMFCQQALIPLS